MKKFLLSMLGVLIALPGIARDFSYEYEGQTLTYTVLDEDAKTCQTKKGNSYSGDAGNKVSGNLQIPSVAKDGDVEYSVTSISQYAFFECSGLTSIEIPNSVTSIGYRAFGGCSGLTSIEIPNSVTSIGNSAFDSCSGLTSVEIPNSVTSLGQYAFYECSGLTSVEIPNSVTSIGSSTFNGCSGLTAVEIPNSVTSIGQYAFGGCRRLKDFTVQDGETELSFVSGALVSAPIENLYMGRNWSYAKNEAISTAIKNVTISDKVTALPNYAFSSCSGLTSVLIPNSVTSIGNSAFSGCSSLKKSAHPDNLSNPFNGGVVISYPAEGSTIEDGIVYGPEKSAIYFASLSLEGEFAVPASVKTIGRSAFQYCSGLTSVEIPNSVTSIGHSAFNSCSGLTSVEIPNSVTSIGEYVFSRCTGLTAVEIPNSITSIGEGVFYNCSGLTSVEIPNSVTSLGKSVFNGCTSLTSVKAMNEVAPVMYDNSFEGLYASATLEVPENAVNNYLASNWSLFENLRAGDHEFSYATYETGNLKYRLIPGKTSEDKNLAVVIPGDYSSLTEITIPERFSVSEDGNNTRYYVDAIGYQAFNGCSNLTTVTFNSKNASKVIGQYAFARTGISAITIPETVETINEHAFDRCSSLEGITVPGSVKTIGDYAFYRTDLKTVVLNEGLETIGANAFQPQDYRRVSEIYIPTTVKSIGEYAFYNLATEQVNISDIKAWLGIDFGNYSANPLYQESPKLCLNGNVVTTISVPEGISEIKPYAFYGYHKLSSIIFNDELQSIGDNAFSFCKGLRSLTFNSGLQSIGNSAFWSCSGLESVKFCDGLRSIGDNAFRFCDFNTISIPGSVSYIGAEAFTGASPVLTFERGITPVEIADNAFKAPVSLSWDRPMESLNLKLSEMATLTIGNSITEIPASKCKGATSLTSLTLGSGLTAIGDEAFSGCTTLTEVIVPPSVETIGASAFAGNTKLTSIIMGHSVKNIGEKAFDLCQAQTVSITAQTPPAAYDNTFSNYTGNLYVQGQDAADAYYDADYCWYQFEGHVMIEPTELKVDGDGTLNGKPGDTFQLTATLYPENVTLPQIFWRSTNPDIATVDQKGLVTLHAHMSEIMAMAEDDAEAGTCKIIAESLYADGPVVEVTVNNVTSGIDEVIGGGNASGDIDFNAPVEIYTLQGVMVGRSAENLAGGIYIVRQGKNVKKIAVK